MKHHRKRIVLVAAGAALAALAVAGTVLATSQIGVTTPRSRRALERRLGRSTSTPTRFLPISGSYGKRRRASPTDTWS